MCIGLIQSNIPWHTQAPSWLSCESKALLIPEDEDGRMVGHAQGVEASAVPLGTFLIPLGTSQPAFDLQDPHPSGLEPFREESSSHAKGLLGRAGLTHTGLP